MTERLEIRLDNKVHIWFPGRLRFELDPLRGALKTDLVLPNPEYYEAQRLGRSTYKIPREINLIEWDQATETASLPRGYWSRLMDWLQRLGIAPHVQDTRTILAPVDYDSRIQLRDYQVEPVAAAVAAGGGIVEAPPGAGKTQMGLEILAEIGQPALWLTHTRDLADQVLDRAEQVLGIPRREIGMIGAGRERVGERLTIGIIPKLAAMDLTQITDRFGAVLLDECFPAGTLVGSQPIEAIGVGDQVPTWDEQLQRLTIGTVTELYRRPIGDKLLRIAAGPLAIACTPNHPFLTPYGWAEADSLREGDLILHAKPPSALSQVREDPNGLEGGALPELPAGGNAPGEGHPVGVQSVRGPRAHYDQATEGSLPGIAPDVLLGSLHEDRAQSNVLRTHGADESEVRVGTDEAEQPHGQSGDEGKIERYPQGHGLEAADTGRERSRAYGGAESAGRGYRMGDRVADLDEDAEEKRLSDLLQSRHRQRGPEDSHRAGRSLPQDEGRPGSGSEEGSLPRWVGVDRIEVLERGSDGTFGGLCADGFVYNLEVEPFRTYVANGIVVHNCHHQAANTWARVVQAFPARYRYGVTGSLKRADGLERISHLVLGPTVAEVSDEQVKAAGGTVTPLLRVVRTEAVSAAWEAYLKREEAARQATKPKPRLEFGPILDEVLHDPERNRLIVDTLAREAPNHYSLVLSDRVWHCEELARALAILAPNLRTAVVHGGLGKKTRRQIFEQARTGDLDVIFAVDLAKEGLDIPRLDRLHLVAGGRNEVELRQKVGRIQRALAGKAQPVIYDYVDFGIGVLAGQWYARRRVYRELGISA